MNSKSQAGRNNTMPAIPASIAFPDEIEHLLLYILRCIDAKPVIS